ncbi:reverse transcriptase N-terminal domain-containing protein [Shewanella psychrophila]|uniref:reverse transcriptase N-terminal domain-containing protein n=1 Tax=Shewanella psychrophila TaxID=225848 RepID=UPI00098B74B4|nr:reverse transcriptase N-terminal domain-containing protein [Shewanella psychrophila]
MITSSEVSASPCSAQWQFIDRKTIEQQVLKLQKRIAKATREGRRGRVKALQ